MKLFDYIKKIRASGVLGINARNGDYIQIYNKRKFYPNADSKVLCKTLAMAAGIPVPELYNVISYTGDLKTIAERLKPYDSFVIKPEHGSGGEGIWVMERTGPNEFRAAGQTYNHDDIKEHLAITLSGFYSLGGQVDRAMVEYKVIFDDVFNAVSYQGIPDIRIVVFLGIPVMAMIRLPTRASKGKANLHQGAIGVGINLATGRTGSGVMGSNLISEHPDTHNPIEGIEIPYWQDMLKIAARSQEIFKLGYMGIDLVLDKNRGPLLLEANVRPGLAVQLANQKGLKARLEFVKKTASNVSDIEERIEIAQSKIASI